MKRRSGGSGAGLDALRQAFGAANLRAVMGLMDQGRSFIARVQAATGEVVDSAGGADILVRVVDVLHELPSLPRLHIPMNMLWRKPVAGETCTVIVPADADTPGGPLALYGDAGATGSVPEWFGSKAGLFVPETVRVESKSNDVEIEAHGQVKLGAAASKKVNREGDAVDCGTMVFAFTPGPAAVLSITYNPPGGAPQVLATGSGTITLSGKTGPGSNKVRAED